MGNMGETKECQDSSNGEGGLLSKTGRAKRLAYMLPVVRNPQKT